MFESNSVAEVIDFSNSDDPMKIEELKPGILVKRFSLPKEEINLLKIKNYKLGIWVIEFEPNEEKNTKNYNVQCSISFDPSFISRNKKFKAKKIPINEDLPEGSPLRVERYKFESGVEYFDFQYEKLKKVTIQINVSDELVGKVILKDIERNYTSTGK
eukprot:gene3456-6105_t